MKHGNLQDDENRKSASHRKTRLKVERHPCRGGVTRSSEEAIVMIVSEGVASFSLRQKTTGKPGGFDEQEQTIRDT